MVSVATIYNCHKQWRKEGLDGLANKVRKGCKPKAMMPIVRNWKKYLKKETSDYGYQFGIWTSDRLRAHLEKETDILLSGCCFRALKKKEYRYRRPKYDLNHLQDQAAKQQTEEVLKALKKKHRRQFQALLCGRSKSELRASSACLLDETSSTKMYFSFAPWHQTASSYFRSLLLER